MFAKFSYESVLYLYLSLTARLTGCLVTTETTKDLRRSEDSTEHTSTHSTIVILNLLYSSEHLLTQQDLHCTEGRVSLQSCPQIDSVNRHDVCFQTWKTLVQQSNSITESRQQGVRPGHGMGTYDALVTSRRIFSQSIPQHRL